MESFLSERQMNLKEETSLFVNREIPAHVYREIDEKDEFPHGLMDKLGQEGFWKINIPEEYGGHGGNVLDLMVFFEEISRALPVMAWTAGDVLLYGNNILKVNGSKSQKDKFLPALANGELKFCFALTEPDAGSDAAAIQTTAEKVNDHYLINGNKVFISGASVADIAVTNTRTAESRYKGITSFLVDTSSEGYQTTPIKKLGYKGSDTCEVVYRDVKVPSDRILGGEECLNKGWEQMMRLLNCERLVLSACALGMSSSILTETSRYAREMAQNAQPAGKYQDIEHEIVDMATRLEAARALAYHTAWLEANNRDCMKETSMTKYYCAELGKEFAWSGMRIMGEEAQDMGSSVQRFFRDMPVLAIGGGTSEIQKNIIAKCLGF